MVCRSITSLVLAFTLMVTAQESLALAIQEGEIARGAGIYDQDSMKVIDLDGAVGNVLVFVMSSGKRCNSLVLNGLSEDSKTISPARSGYSRIESKCGIQVYEFSDITSISIDFRSSRRHDWHYQIFWLSDHCLSELISCSDSGDAYVSDDRDLLVLAASERANLMLQGINDSGVEVSRSITGRNGLAMASLKGVSKLELSEVRRVRSHFYPGNAVPDQPLRIIRRPEGFTVGAMAKNVVGKYMRGYGINYAEMSSFSRMCFEHPGGKVLVGLYSGKYLNPFRRKNFFSMRLVAEKPALGTPKIYENREAYVVHSEAGNIFCVKSYRDERRFNGWMSSRRNDNVRANVNKLAVVAVPIEKGIERSIVDIDKPFSGRSPEFFQLQAGDDLSSVYRRKVGHVLGTQSPGMLIAVDEYRTGRRSRRLRFSFNSSFAKKSTVVMPHVAGRRQGTVSYYYLPVCETSFINGDKHGTGWSCATDLGLVSDRSTYTNGTLTTWNTSELGDDFRFSLASDDGLKIDTWGDDLKLRVFDANGVLVQPLATGREASNRPGGLGFERRMVFGLAAGEYLVKLLPRNRENEFHMSLQASSRYTEQSYLEEVTRRRRGVDGIPGQCSSNSPKAADSSLSGVIDFSGDSDCYRLLGTGATVSITNDDSALAVRVDTNGNATSIKPGTTLSLWMGEGEEGYLYVSNRTGRMGSYSIPITIKPHVDADGAESSEIQSDTQVAFTPTPPSVIMGASSLLRSTFVYGTELGAKVYASLQVRNEISENWAPDKLSALDYFVYSRVSNGAADAIKNPATYTYWSHAGLFSGEDEYGSKSIIHAVGSGHSVVETPASFYLDKQIIKKLYWVSQPINEEVREQGLSYLRNTFVDQVPYSLINFPNSSSWNVDVLSDAEKLGIYCSGLVRVVYDKMEFNTEDGTYNFAAPEYSDLQAPYKLFYSPLDLAANAVEIGKVAHVYENLEATNSSARTLLKPGGTWGDYIENRNDEDWYQLSVEQGKTYQVSTEASISSMDTVLYIYEYCGSCESKIFKLVSVNNDKETGGEYSEIAFTASESDNEVPKIYYAMVRGNLDSIGGYRILLQSIE